jgi:hypothetical protein
MDVKAALRGALLAEMHLLDRAFGHLCQVDCGFLLMT